MSSISLNIPDAIPSAESVKRRFSAHKKFSYLVLAITILLDIFFIYQLWEMGDRVSDVTVFFSLLGCFALFVIPYALILFQKKTELKYWQGDVGRYTHEDVMEMVAEVLEAHKGGEIPTIYITHQNTAEAYAIDSMLFNSFKFVNAVYVSRFVFSTMDKKEIKAILEHEMGHFNQYMYPLNRARVFYALLFGLIPPVLFTWAQVESVLSMIFGWVIIQGLGATIYSKFSFQNSKDLEYLCDLQAAERYGKISLINALFSVSKNAELVEYMIEVVTVRARDSGQFPTKTVNVIIAEVVEDLPDDMINEQELNEIIDAVMQSEDIENLKKEFTDSEWEEELKRYDSLLEEFKDKQNFKLLDWKHFDFVEKDGKVCEKEYPHLIKALVEQPEHQLFDMIYDNKHNVFMSTHPTIRQRVLFLEKAQVR